MPEKIPSTASRGACPSCGLERVGDNLDIFKARNGCFYHRCYACVKRRANEYYARNAERVRQRNRNRYARKQREKANA